MNKSWARWIRVGLMLLGIAAFGHTLALADDNDHDTVNSAASVSMAFASDSSDTAEAPPSPTKPAPRPRRRRTPAAAPAGTPQVNVPEVADAAAAEAKGRPGDLWFQADYLHYWTTGAHLPAMVSTAPYDVVTNSRSLPVPAAEALLGISQQTLFGDKYVEVGGHEGYRIDTGVWLEDRHILGIESEYLDLGRNSNNYDSGWSDGSPAILRPVHGLDNTGVYQYRRGNRRAEGHLFRTRCRRRNHGSDQRLLPVGGHGVALQPGRREWIVGNGDSASWLDGNARSFRIDGIFGFRYYRLIDAVDSQEIKARI